MISWPAVALLLVVVVGVYLVLRLTAPARGRRRNARMDERAGAVAAALAGRGLPAEREAVLAPAVARLDLAMPRPGVAPPWLVRSVSADCTILVFDQEVRRGRAGWNEEVVSENRIYRHTLVAVHSLRLALAAFDLVPNVRAVVRTGIDEGVAALRDRDPELHAAVEGSRAARWMLRASDGLLAMEERAGALDIDERPELAAACRAFGDAAAVPLLLDRPVAALLLEHPGLLVSAAGEWLVVGRNVRLGYGSEEGDEGLPFGLLTAARSAELATIALELEELLRR